jgi:hypothetical protein
VLRGPRTHSGRESGPGSGAGSRLTGFRCPFRGLSGLDVCRRVERASACVRPSARAISREPGGPGDRDACGASGAGAAGPRVRGGAARPGHPCGDVAALLVDELFVNSIRHSGSGAPGETVTVAVRTENDVIRVEVTDRSGPGVPEPRPAGSDAEGGRGLHLVARLVARWGWRRHGGRTVTWFELSRPCCCLRLAIDLVSTSCVRGRRCLPAAAQVVGTGFLTSYIAGQSRTVAGTSKVNPEDHSGRVFRRRDWDGEGARAGTWISLVGHARCAADVSLSLRSRIGGETACS